MSTVESSAVESSVEPLCEEATWDASGTALDPPGRQAERIGESAASPRTTKAVPAAKKRWMHGVNWPVFGWIAFLHAGALAAPFFFTWKSVLLFVGLAWFSGGVGITLGYHRLLTHGSFQTYRWVRRFCGVAGTLAGEGPPLMWVATHREHHALSDQEGDPHSPRDGYLWSHVVWLFPAHEKGHQEQLYQRYAPDLLKDPFMRFLDRTFLLWHWALGFGLFFAGWIGWDLYTAWSFVFWGIFLRLVVVLHVTWFVNSATHIWGYRNYETSDNSRNLWWVALLSFGEGWHNNHHAHQRSARHGHRWWELDPTFGMIRLMERVGLAWKVADVREPKSGRSAAV